MWGAWPVLVNQYAVEIPPVLFAAIATLFGSFAALAYALVQGTYKELAKKEAYASLFMITLFIVVIPYSLFFLGASKTSGVNASMLLLAEIPFTLLFTHFIGEKTTRLKLLGAGGVFVGALLVVFNGNEGLNAGDLIIIASTASYPIGNFYAKKALQQVSPATILFVRFLLGSAFLFALSFVFEDEAKNVVATFNEYWLVIAGLGIVFLGIGKVLWYASLKHLDISKAISLAMTFPLASLVILIAFYDASLTPLKWIGVAIMLIGVFFSVKRPSIASEKTKYHVNT